MGVGRIRTSLAPYTDKLSVYGSTGPFLISLYYSLYLLDILVGGVGMCSEWGERKVSSEEIFEHTGIRVSDSSVSRRKVTNRYVASIPLQWIQTATRLPGKSLHVAVVIWYHWRCGKRAEVALTRAKLEAFGVNRKRTRESLDRLESAGLISVRRQGRQAPRILVHEKGGTEGGQDE
jgi:hypothetical protein